MKKKTIIEGRINELKRLVGVEIPALIEKKDDSLYQTVNYTRYLIIETITGTTFDTCEDGKIKIKIETPVPSGDEMSKILAIIETLNSMFVLKTANANNETDEDFDEDFDDDMEFSSNFITMIETTSIDSIKIMTNKNFKNILTNMIYADVFTSASANTLINATNRWRKFIGVRNGVIITIAVAAVATAGYFIWDNKFRDKTPVETETTPADEDYNNDEEYYDDDEDDDDVIIVKDEEIALR